LEKAFRLGRHFSSMMGHENSQLFVKSTATGRYESGKSNSPSHIISLRLLHSYRFIVY